MNNDKKYDVFISYSRKDYMLNDEIIPGNPISAIQEMFEEHKISYWFDKDGIYSGSEFMPLISDAISDSKILVFISSKHSNESKWTAGEILEALNEDKLVIPVRIDDSKYDKSFRIRILPLDFIDYYDQPQTALQKLLTAVKIEMDRLALIAENEQRKVKEKEMVVYKESLRKEIKEKAKEYLALVGQQNYILQELYAKNISIGISTKCCPVCNSDVPIKSNFCGQCGWQFPYLYGIDCRDTLLHDEKQLELARMLWNNYKQKGKQIDNTGEHSVTSQIKTEHISVEKDIVVPLPSKQVSRTKEKKESDPMIYPRLNWEPIEKDGKYGFIEVDSGAIKIECEWKYADIFKEGLARVQNADGFWGFIDYTGESIIPCVWKSASNFKRGLAKVQNKWGDYGYVDRKGFEIIPCRWGYADSFVEGLARVKDPKGKYGFVNRSGEIVIPCEWINAYSFKNNQARVQGEDGDWRVIDRKGKVVNKEQ